MSLTRIGSSMVPAAALAGVFAVARFGHGAPAAGPWHPSTLGQLQGQHLPAPALAPQDGGEPANHTPMTYGTWGAGFIADAPVRSHFTAVSTRFIAPPAPASAASGWVAIWDGIGLAVPAGDQLMQSGISMESTAQGTWQATVPWWINEPSTPTVPHVMSLAVAPGDTVEVDVGQLSAEAWGFRVTDLSTGASAYGSCTGCASDATTAAWIVEDPTSSSGSGQTAYADPARVQFLSASAAVDWGQLVPLSQLSWHPLLRVAGDSQDGPVDPPPSASGGFTVAHLQN